LSHLSVEVNRKKGENFDALIRRFQRRYQQSGRGLQSRKIRFRTAEPNRNKSRASALRRQSKKEQFEYLMKTGQLKEEPKKRKYGRR
jgi:ribosomal protein S21